MINSTDIFKGIYKNGLMSNNRYELFITPPKNLNVPQIIRYCCNSISITKPLAIVSTQKIYNYDRKVITNINRSEGLRLSIISDADGIVEKFFNDWFNLAWNNEKYSMNYFEDYISQCVEIKRYNKNNKLISTEKYYNAFLGTPGNIEVGMDVTVLSPFEVTLEYEYSESVKIGTSTKSFVNVNNKSGNLDGTILADNTPDKLGGNSIDTISALGGTQNA